MAHGPRADHGESRQARLAARIVFGARQQRGDEILDLDTGGPADGHGRRLAELRDDVVSGEGGSASRDPASVQIGPASTR
jgi:hypothetical protein